MPKERAFRVPKAPMRPRVELVFCGFFEEGCFYCGNSDFKVIDDYNYPVRICFDCHMQGCATRMFGKSSR